MKNRPILHVNLDGQVHAACLFDSESKHLQRIDDWQSLRKEPLTLVLPAEWCYQTTTQIASKSPELLRKSIPYAVEEELSNDVEDNYFAHQITGDSSQAVVAIEKQRLNDLLEWVKSEKLSVTSIKSELDWLPSEPNVVHVWSTPQRSLIRFGTEPLMALPNSQLASVMELYAGDHKGLRCNDVSAMPTDRFESMSQLSEEACLQELCREDSFEFYLDELKQKEQGREKSSQVGLITAAALLVLSWLGINGYEYLRLKTGIDEIKQQQTQLLVSRFADAAGTELLDPYAAMSSRLKQADASGQTNQSGLTEAMFHLASAQKNSPQVQLTGLRLVDREYEIQIKAPSMAIINAFHQTLQNHATGFRTQVGVNELADDNNYQSILTMVKL